MYLRFDAASVVVSTSSSPDRAAQISRCIYRLVTGDGIGARGFPWFGILARRDDGVSASRRNRIVAFSGIIGAVSRDATDGLTGRDLVQQFRQHRCITNVAGRYFDRPDLQSFLVDPYVYLAPNAPLGAAVLAGVPFTFAFGLDTCSVNQQLQQVGAAAVGAGLRSAFSNGGTVCCNRARPSPTRPVAQGSRRSRSFAAMAYRTGLSRSGKPGSLRR